MNVAEYLVDFFINNGVTDVFGIPGGVVLDLLYAIEQRPEISSHLSYHEQAAAFEACGYSQFDYTLGVAYATRGPGFTNLITGIADAYADSIPVMFITSHSSKMVGHMQRFEMEQEIDTVQMVKSITKYAATVDNLDEVYAITEKAAYLAMTGRKGPVFLDFSASLWNKEIKCPKIDYIKTKKFQPINEKQKNRYSQIIQDSLRGANRPICLLGDGIRQSKLEKKLVSAVNHMGFPVLTSRGAQDIGRLCENYYGYIGSHGIRYSNFIFAKADLVIALGNRLAFPSQSESYMKALSNKKILWVETDENELKRAIPNTIGINATLEEFAGILANLKTTHQKDIRWLHICKMIKEELQTCDTNDVVKRLSHLMEKLPDQFVFVSDVGNHEFWISRSYELCGVRNRILYSRSFGALGCSIAKAIGATCRTKQPSVCFIGDQGFQMNLQELELIVKEKLPILIVIINNQSSGMIKDRQDQIYAGHHIHTTRSSGYGIPDICLLAQSYGIKYLQVKQYEDILNIIGSIELPYIIEEVFDENISLIPVLPKGNPIQDMSPKLDRNLYEALEQL